MSYLNYSPDKPSLSRLSINIAQILYFADEDVQKIYHQFRLLSDPDLHLVNLSYHIKFLGPISNKLRLFLEKSKILQNLNWNTFFQITTIFSFSPTHYLLMLLLGLYSIPYRSTTLDDFKTLFHHLGLDTSFDASRLSQIFAQINPLSKGHYIVGTKIQLLVVLCPDIFKFLYEIQNEFQSHFFNKKICKRIINRLNNIERIKNTLKTYNRFPFPTCCDRLKNILFNVSNPYQYDYFIPDEDEEEGVESDNDVEEEEEEEEVEYEYRSNHRNNNNRNRSGSSGDSYLTNSSRSYNNNNNNNNRDESDSLFKRSRFRTSSSDNDNGYKDLFSTTTKHKITFINIIEKFLYIIFPSRRLIGNNGFCNKMVSRCKLVGESYSVEKYPVRYPSHVSAGGYGGGTSFFSDSGVMLDRQQQQYQPPHLFSSRGLYENSNSNLNNRDNKDNNGIIGLNGLVCSESNNNNQRVGRPYSGTLNTITFNYDTAFNNNNNNNIVSPLMSPSTSGHRKKTSLLSDMNGILLNSSVVNNIHQSEQLCVNYQTTNRSYTNNMHRQYSQSNSRCDYGSLSPPHVNNKLKSNNNNINTNNINISTKTTDNNNNNNMINTATPTIITVSSTNEESNNNNNNNNELEKSRISLRNS